MQILKLKLSELTPNTGQIPGLPSNPRQWTKGDVDKIAASLKETPELFEARPVLVIPHDGEYVILGGNLRYEGARANKDKEVPAIIFPEDSPLDLLKRVVILDNGSFGAWDYDALANEWDDLPLGDWGVPAWNTEEENNLNGISDEVKEDEFDEDVEARCQPGDIWQLGNHRLMCGDSTDAAQVALLMNGEKADIAFTSPPYGVNDGSLRNHQEKGKPDKSAKNFYKEYNDTQDAWPGLMEQSYQRMHEYSGQQFINVQLLSDNKRELLIWAARHANNLSDVLIWDKGHAAPQMSKNVVNNNYEFIFVFAEDGASRAFKFGDFHGNINATIRVDVGQNEYADVHKAVFPVALPAEILRINSKAQSVLDLFGGTGTTMIAAEQMERRCFMMELDSHYCDIILARWEKLTGQTATKL